MPHADRFADRETAFVVGAARGLGSAIADGLAREGVRVVGTSRSKVEADSIAKRYGTFPVVLDLEDVARIPLVVDEVHALTGGFTLLVNNAGVNIPEPAIEVSQEHWQTIYNTNVQGPFFVAQETAKHWIGSGTKGSMVFVSSQAGTVAIENRVAYGSSKAAVSHMTRQLAFEWARHGIRVNAVAPTFVHTELTASTLNNPALAGELLERIPLGRFGVPDDVATSVTFLLSQDASLITGHILAIDGGYTIH